MSKRKLPGYFNFQYKIKTENEITNLFIELKDKIEFRRLKIKYNELQNIGNLEKGITKASRLKEDYNKWVKAGKPEKFIA